MVRGKTLPATRGRKEREMAKGGDWKTKMVSFVLGFARRRIEIRLEDWLLNLCQKYPFVRQTYEQLGKEATLDLVGGLINLLPEPDSSTSGGVVKQFAIDFAEIIPRELGRILDARSDLAPGGSVVTGVTPAGSAGDFLRFLETELAPRFAEFGGFFARLPSDAHRDAVRRFILSRPTAEIAAFMALTVPERVRMVALLMPPAPTAAPTRGVSVEAKKTFADVVKKIRTWDQRFAPKKREPKER